MNSAREEGVCVCMWVWPNIHERTGRRGDEDWCSIVNLRTRVTVKV